MLSVAKAQPLACCVGVGFERSVLSFEFSVFSYGFLVQLHTLKGNTVMTANCPECEAEVTLADGVVEGEIIVCPDCAAELEVVSVNPPELALAPEVGEDWGE